MVESRADAGLNSLLKPNGPTMTLGSGLAGGGSEKVRVTGLVAIWSPSVDPPTTKLPPETSAGDDTVPAQLESAGY